MAQELGTSSLRLEQEGSIAWCIIDRPAARNALTPAHVLRHQAGGAARQHRPDLAALIITGVDDVFAPGGDLGGRSEPGETRPDAVGSDILPFLAIRDSRAPVIAAVNGICQAGGLLIAMMADIAVASDRATFRVPELLRGHPRRDLRGGAAGARRRRRRPRPAALGAPLRRRGGGAPRGDLAGWSRTTTCATAALEAARQVLQTAPDARVHVKRMLNERYGTIDYQTMFWALEHSPEPREGMHGVHGEAATELDPRRRLSGVCASPVPGEQRSGGRAPRSAATSAEQ